MFRNYLDKIERDEDVRKNLIELRKLLKTEPGSAAWQRDRQRCLSLMLKLLKHEDAKVRKNAALILGEMGCQDALDALFYAYECEEKLFVKSAYLTAMSQLDYRTYLNAFRERMEELMQMEMTPENQKHLNEELKLLRDMLLIVEKPVKHTFTGYSVPSEMILLTSPGMEQLTIDVMPRNVRDAAKAMRGGVRILAERPGELFGIRTVKGFMFRFCANPLKATDYQAVATAIHDAGLTDYLKKRHEGDGPFYFRIDLRTKLVLNEKSQYVKRLGAQLERLSGHHLQNSVSNYECELRITENKQGQYSVYLILHTIADSRFSYRRNAIATSMHPVKAAEVVSIASEYLADDADVLDPFCGTATLLIERYRKRKAAHLYGVDIFGEAIDGARENASLANVPSYFINKDFAEFSHSYTFDEVLTELPAGSDKMTPDVLFTLYKNFVRKLNQWMTPGGYAIVVTTEKEYLLSLAARSGYLKAEKEWALSGKKTQYVVVLRYRG